MSRRLSASVTAAAVSFGFAFALAMPVGAAAETTLTVSQGVDVGTLDPLRRTITPTTNADLQMFDTLLRHDTNGKLVPELALSYQRIAPTIWEFKLRKGVKFWNGDPLTSADVKFTIDKIKDPAELSEQVPRVNTIARVETPDPYTVRYVTTRPVAVIPGNPWQIFIVDAKYWQAHGDAYQVEHPMGSGPFVYTSWRKDEQLEMAANPSFWRGKPAFDRLIFKPIPEAASRVAALRTGETDVITNVPAQYQLQLVGGRNTRLTSARSDRVLYVGFNMTKPGPQNNKLVRQAFNYAIDKKALVNGVLGGRGYVIATPLPPNFVGYDAAIPAYDYDPEKAKALLAKAGFPGGKGLEFTINAPTGRYNKDKELGEAIAGQLAAIGVKADARIQEWGTYFTQVGQRALTPAYMLGWGNDSFDADNTLTSLLSTGARLSPYSNPELDKLIENARFELDPKKRDAVYAKALAIVHEEAPWIFLFQYEDLYATTKRVHWQARPDELIYCEDIKIDS